MQSLSMELISVSKLKSNTSALGHSQKLSFIGPLKRGSEYKHQECSVLSTFSWSLKRVSSGSWETLENSDTDQKKLDDLDPADHSFGYEMKTYKNSSSQGCLPFLLAAHIMPKTILNIMCRDPSHFPYCSASEGTETRDQEGLSIQAPIPPVSHPLDFYEFMQCISAVTKTFCFILRSGFLNVLFCHTKKPTVIPLSDIKNKL